jgi:hypothetical protein
VPWSKTPHRRHREVLAPEGSSPTQVPPIRSDTRTKLVTAIARARRWLSEIEAGAATLDDIAARETCSKRHVNMTISLAFLAPSLLAGGAGAPVYNDLRARTLAAGLALGREIIVLDIRNSRELETAFTALAEQGAGAVIVGSFTSLSRMRDGIISLAQHYHVPAMYPFAYYTRVGGLMSYTADSSEADRLLGSKYVGRLLKGIKPSDLPVQQPTKFELTINLKTAKALGLTIPETLLAIADEVIQ